MIKLTLPAVNLPDTVTDTAFGKIIVPAQIIPQKTIEIDPTLINTLLQQARNAAQQAYAPYSNFKVGAALIMADDPEGKIYTGTNVENSSYGGTVCAERSALLHRISAGFRRLKYLAVSTADALDLSLSERSPCGLCRQVIKEFTDKDIATDETLIFIDNGDPETLCEILDIERLLPYGFNFSPEH